MTAADAPGPPDLVIGIGHRFRCDDGAGPAVAAALQARGFCALIHEGEGSALLELWQGRRHVVVVDAMTGDDPGDVLRITAGALAAYTTRFVRSTHDLGLPEAVALGQTFGRLPRHLEVIGIVGRDFRLGETLSPAVGVAVDRVVADLSAAFAQSSKSRLLDRG